MLRRLFSLDAKASGRSFAVSFGPSAAWSPRGYAAFAREGYGRNAVAHRCVRLIAEAAAACPIRTAAEGRRADDVRALLARPNPDQSSAELMETVHGHLQVAGDAYLELAGVDDAGSLSLYALRPDRMRVLTGPKGWADGWEYRTGQGVRTFARDRASGRAPICHLKLFNPADDHYGLSPMEPAARAIDVHMAGGAWAKALLDNAARPSGALVVSSRDGAGRLTEAQYERLKDELEALHAGPENAGRPMLLEGGLDWKPMGHSPAEMDFIEARREAAREIALAFGVPPMLLGLPGDNTYSNYREANLAFYRQTVLPLARKTAAALQAWLRPWLGEDLTLAADEDALPALSEERAAQWRRVGEAAFLSDAEKRRLLGLEAR